MDQPGIEQDGDGPHDRVMEARVTRLEDDMTDVRAILRRLEPMIIRIDAAIPHLATKLEMSQMRAELKDEIVAVRTELKEEIISVRTELKDEIISVRTELKEEISSVRTELKEEIGSVRSELHRETTSLRQEITSVRIDLGKEISDVSREMTDIRREITDGRVETSGVREELALQIGSVRAELERRPTSVGMWTMGLTVATLSLAGLAGGAVFLPFIYHILHIAPP